MVRSKRVKKEPKPKNIRRNIRKIIKNADLSEFTKIAVQNERKRKQRLKNREKMVCNLIKILWFFFSFYWIVAIHFFVSSSMNYSRIVIRMNYYWTSMKRARY